MEPTPIDNEAKKPGEPKEDQEAAPRSRSTSRRGILAGGAASLLLVACRDTDEAANAAATDGLLLPDESLFSPEELPLVDDGTGTTAPTNPSSAVAGDPGSTTNSPLTASPTNSTTTTTPSSGAATSSTTTAAPSTSEPATATPTTVAPAATAPTTAAPTTAAPTTTATPTTEAPTTTEAPPPEADPRMVASRLTFGVTPEIDEAIDAMGVDAWIEDQLAKNSPDEVVEAQLVDYATLRVTPYVARPFHAGMRVHAQEVVYSTMTRARYSDHQLFEMMCQMWMDHFNLSFGDRLEYKHMWFQEQAIRPNAMGSFADLLVATATNGSMLEYLNNDISNAQTAINENYGRELIELHTLGIDDAGSFVYSEDDVIGTSHVMSGWSREFSNNSEDFHQFLFRDDYHSTQAVTLLGGEWSNTGLSGKDAGDSLLQFLARHPSTAQHVCRRICRRFVSDSPSSSLVANAARVYLDNDTDIRSVLRFVFSSAEFLTSEGNKLRRPFELVAATMRALDTELPDAPRDDPGDFVQSVLNDVGHRPWTWTTPDGYPDVASAWLNSGQFLMNWEHLNLIVKRTADVVTPVDSIRGSATTAGELFDSLALRLNLGDISSLKDEVLGYVGLTSTSLVADISDNDVRALAQFLVAHPHFLLR